MNAFFDRLMVHVPSGYDKLPNDVPSLTINGTGNVAIQGDRMYVSTSTQSVTIDLHSQTVGNIAQQMPSGVTATVLQDGMAELLLLPYQYANATLPVTLTIPTNGLWFIVGAMARNLESRKRSLLNQVAQINLSSAITRILDWWGATTGVERLQGEPDILYAQRIQSLKFEPNVNNIAIENVLKKLGYYTDVNDSGPGSFDVNVFLPQSPPSGFTYTTAQLSDAVNTLKAAGVQAQVILQQPQTDTVELSDSTTQTVSDNTTYVWSGWTCSLLGVLYVIPANWTWGTGEWIGTQRS